MDNLNNKIDSSKTTTPKQDLINNLIWILIFNSIFAHFGKQMENGNVTTFNQIIWIISSLFLFGALFALTKVLSRFNTFKNKIFSFIIALIIMLVINFLLLAIIP